MAVLAGAPAGALASAKGEVTGQIIGAPSATAQVSFNAGGTPTRARGHFTYLQASGRTLKGTVTCYYQQGERAVFSGPAGRPPQAFFTIAVDGFQDSFSVVTGGPDPPGACATNFPLDAFDDPDFLENVAYRVTSGDIVVR